MTTLDKIQKLVQESLDSCRLNVPKDFQVIIEYPRDVTHGDYATNTALRLSKELGKNPREIAEVLVESIASHPEFSNLLSGTPEIAGPGFINFKVSNQELENSITQAIEEKEHFGHSDTLEGKKYMVEFAHPNTHKAVHIGHLRNICLGEALVRILESQSAEIFRANYQGDVGPHVASCIWGMMNLEDKNQRVTNVEEAKTFEKENLTAPRSKVEYLGRCYAYGAKAFRENPEHEAQIRELNKQIYAKDPSITPLWEATRQWSLDYFDFFYQRVGSTFDRFYFEGEMYERGIEIVKEHLGKIFEESEGALIFRGEEHSLHTRVFVTKEGNATYEGKDLANVETQYSEYKFDQILHLVASEQEGYFDVVFKAAELINPELVGKQVHISYGMVNLSTGKMSSRTGKVITAGQLIDQAKDHVTEILKESKNVEESNKEKTAEKVAIAAVKYTMLHADSRKDIAFDMEQSLRLNGDSGPYLLYGYTRVSSVLSKVSDLKSPDYSKFNDQDWNLAKKLLKFQEEVTKSAEDYTTHNLTHFLVETVSEFSSWYEKNRVTDAEDGLKAARVSLLQAVKQLLENGLYLLGIEKVDRM